MPFQIVRNDITEMKVDAIVNSSNSHLIGTSGADGMIHRKAGPQLGKACSALGGCEPGEAKSTPGFCLPCRYIIHTVTPVWKDGLHSEREKLTECYLHSLQLAEKLKCESIAFPLMSSGINGFPKDEALSIANEVIRNWLDEHYLDVYLVVFDRQSFALSEKLQKDIRQYIDDHYVSTKAPKALYRRMTDEGMGEACDACLSPVRNLNLKAVAGKPGKLELDGMPDWELDESFSQMLLRKIDERGLKDSQCYNRANVDRRLFSKIRSDPRYHPAKTTVIALGLALELSLPEMEELLNKAGYALSDSQLGDVIVKYFINRNNYDIFLINETLYAEDQQILYGR